MNEPAALTVNIVLLALVTDGARSTVIVTVVEAEE
jgi:hypothetical protein